MLRQLLSILADGGLHTRSELAASLGTSGELVDQMLQTLADQGLIVCDGPCETGYGCSRCPSGTVCGVSSARSLSIRTLAARKAATRTGAEAS